MPPRTLLATAVVAAALPLTGAVAAPPDTPPPAAPAPRATPCAKPTDQPGDTSAKVETTSGGLERSYVLRLPRGYERRDDWPLVVAFHGRGSTGTEVEGYSRLDSLPAVVAYPNGVVGTGDGSRQAWQGAPYAAPGVDDVAFAADLLDEVQADYCVDPARSYATGKSNGAGLVGLLACRQPDRWAAVAPVAGAFYPGTEEGCGAPEDAVPVPVLDVHGTGDTTIPYAGDPDRDLPAIPDWVAARAERNGCAEQPRERRIRRDVTRYRWVGCTDGADVEHVAVTDGGHVWPGASVYSGGGHNTRSIRTERLVWRFVRGHRLEATRTTGTERSAS